MTKHECKDIVYAHTVKDVNVLLAYLSAASLFGLNNFCFYDKNQWFLYTLVDDSKEGRAGLQLVAKAVEAEFPILGRIPKEIESE